MGYVKAIAEGIDEELGGDDRVCLFGQDVSKFGAVWWVSPKLQQQCGQRRVFDTPVSEGAIIGTAIGAAMTSLRPMTEIPPAAWLRPSSPPTAHRLTGPHREATVVGMCPQCALRFHRKTVKNRARKVNLQEYLSP